MLAKEVCMVSNRAALWCALLGNFFKHYDTALFGFLAPFLAPLIFPKDDPLTALILTYGMIPVGMIAKPIGAVVFGYWGDLYGRRRTLFWNFAGMSFVSGLIAFSPMYKDVGVWAPLIFCIGRVLQNFFSSGMGGGVFLLENAPVKHHDLLSSFYGMTTIGGILLASAGVVILNYFGGIDSGWRILYLIGCLSGLFGLVIRREVDPNLKRVAHSNLLHSLWSHRRALTIIAVISGFSYANYSIAIVLMNGFIPLVSEVTKEAMISLNTALLLFDFCALPLGGILSSKISREKVMFIASLAVILLGIPLTHLLPNAGFGLIVCIRAFLVLIGVIFCAPFHAWANDFVPKEHRCTVISVGYAIGSQLFGGQTAVISLWAYKMTAMPSSIVWYWMILAFLSALALIKCKSKSLEKIEEVL
jgi:MHS family proline/betaine transporter-like MFS transporter